MKGTYDAAGRLARRARALDGARAGLPSLFAFTDPDRGPDPVTLASGLPAGTGLVLRTFGHARLQAAAPEIAAIARRRGLVFLIAAEPELALACGATGVHWPQARLGSAGRWARCFERVSASAHDPDAARQAMALADLVFVSPAFASSSPSAGRAIGAFRIAAYARRAHTPVYALGGVNDRTIRRLEGLGISGVAAVSGVAD